MKRDTGLDSVRRQTRVFILMGGLFFFVDPPGSSQERSQPIKVIVDTDLGFASDDAMALLILLQSDKVDLLGVTVVTGNDWLEQEIANSLRLLEIAGRPDVPVYAGSERPLVNSQEEMLRREALFGETSDGGYKGAWRDGGPGPREVRPPDGRFATGQPEPDPAANFIIATVRRYPGEVVLAAIGPLTNVALALAKDPEIASLAREIVIMGGGIESRPEFNFWMDPEAARIVLRAPWRRLTLTPLDICEQAPFTREVATAAAEGDSPIARYFAETFLERAEHPVSPLMYDQIAVLSLLEPSVIARVEEMWLDVEIDHGASYGAMLFWDQDRVPPTDVRAGRVQIDLDYRRFVETFIKLMRRPVRSPDAQ
ncbi:MAG TPA: nucleoside hydrolase [Vicinamibacteria bacterium]|jgi:inosine-uridine nucleoside N-ribohydrolase